MWFMWDILRDIYRDMLSTALWFMEQVTVTNRGEDVIIILVLARGDTE